jgi:hypothetical protein
MKANGWKLANRRTFAMSRVMQEVALLIRTSMNRLQLIAKTRRRTDAAKASLWLMKPQTRRRAVARGAAEVEAADVAVVPNQVTWKEAASGAKGADHAHPRRLKAAMNLATAPMKTISD